MERRMAALPAVRGGALLVLLLFGVVPPASGQEARARRVVLSLREAVRMAVVRSPEVKSTTFEAEALLGKRGLARLENAAGRDVEEIRALVTEGTRSPRAEVSR